MHSMISCNRWNNMATSLLSFAINGSWSVMIHTLCINSGASLAHVAFPEPHVLYCCNATLCIIGFCQQMQLGIVLHCLVLCYTHNSCHPLPVIIQLQGQHLMHQLPSIGVYLCIKISAMHLIWIYSLLCYTGSDTCHFMSSLP